MKVDYTVNFDKLLDKMDETFADDGSLQIFIDNEVIRICNPYVPMDQGSLADSAIDATVVGSGAVEYATPYARRHYYNPVTIDGKKDPEYKWQNGGVQDGGKRGHYWADRAMDDGGLEKLTEGCNQHIRKALS